MATPAEDPNTTALIVGSLARTFGAVASGYLVAKGVSVDDATSIIGGVGTLAIGAWSIWQKMKIVKTAKTT